MKGPFYIKTKQNRCAVIQPCKDCTYCKNETSCMLADCPFYFNDYGEDDDNEREITTAS